MGKHNSVITSGRVFVFPATGFQSDVEILLQKFVETKTVRFEEFSRLWREGKYSLIHAGRRGMREKREFCEEAFKIVLKFLIPPYSLQVRIGSLYLLYALYHTQRLAPRVRIRVPLACLQHLQDLHQDVIAKKHLDTDYILRKMKSDGMFEYCAYPSHLSIEDLYTCDQDEADVHDVNRNQVKTREKSLFDKIWDEDNIGQLNAVHEKYHQLKCLQNGERGGDPNVPSSSLDLIQSDVVSSIQLVTQEEEQAVILSPIRKPPPSERSATESSKRAQIVREIKARAVAARANTDSGALRYLNTSPPRSSMDELSSPASPPRKKKRGRPYSKPTRKFHPDTDSEDRKCPDGAEEEIRSPRVIPSKKTNAKSPDIFSVNPLYNREEINVKSEKDPGGGFPTENDGFSLLVSNAEAVNQSSDVRGRENSEGNDAGTSEALFNDDDDSENGDPKVPKVVDEKKIKARKAKMLEKQLEKKLSKVHVPDDRESSAIKLVINKFIALKPLPGQKECPIVAKVISFNEENVEVIWYEGAYDTKWTESKKGSGEDRKFKKETISRDRVLINIPITGAGKLSGKILRKLKLLYSKINYKS